MLRVVPDRIVKAQDTIANWGGMGSMSDIGFEHQAIGSIRYVCEGSREVMVVKYSDCYKWFAAIEKAAGHELKPFGPEFTVMHMVSDFFSKKMPAEAWELIESIGGSIYKCSNSAKSMLYTPTASVVVDRALGGAMVYGWRATCVENADAGERMALLRSHMLTYTNSGVNNVLSIFDTIDRTVAKLGLAPPAAGTAEGATGSGDSAGSGGAADRHGGEEPRVIRAQPTGGAQIGKARSWNIAANFLRFRPTGVEE